MLFQELGKLKRSSIMMSIIMMAVGLLMIVWPQNHVDVLVSALGYGMLVLAVVMVLDFIAGKRVLINYISLTAALIVGLLGVVVLIFDNIVLAIGLVFGLWLILDGVLSLFNATTYARRAQRQGWQILVVLSVLLILFGLIVLVNPWWDSPARLFDVIGGMLLFSSVVGIVRLIFIWPLKSE